MMCPLDENGQTTCPDLNSPDIPWYFNGNYIVILIVCVVVVPLASLKSIEFLGYTSGNKLYGDYRWPFATISDLVSFEIDQLFKVRDPNLGCRTFPGLTSLAEILIA